MPLSCRSKQSPRDFLAILAALCIVSEAYSTASPGESSCCTLLGIGCLLRALFSARPVEQCCPKQATYSMAFGDVYVRQLTQFCWERPQAAASAGHPSLPLFVRFIPLVAPTVTIALRMLHCLRQRSTTSSSWAVMTPTTGLSMMRRPRLSTKP